MAGYVIMYVQITNQELLDEFLGPVRGVIESYGGKFLVRGGAFDVIEGYIKPDRIVVVEFESVEQAHTWSNSEEFLALRQMRLDSTNMSKIIVQGV